MRPVALGRQIWIHWITAGSLVKWRFRPKVNAIQVRNVVGYACWVESEGNGRGDPVGIPRVITAMATNVAM
jgi:hypothetical protein